MSMARPNQEAIETFMSITGLSEPIAVQKLEEHGGNLNEAVNAHFSEGDRNLSTSTLNTSAALPQDDFMDIDNELNAEMRRPLSLLSSARTNPFSLLDPTIGRSIFDNHLDPTNRSPFVTHPREAHGPDIHGTVIIHDDDDDIPPAQTAARDEQMHTLDRNARPSAPEFENLPDYGNDIEEEMIRAAIEASKREAEEKYSNQNLNTESDFSEPGAQRTVSHLDDPELAHAVSLSLKTAEQEKQLRMQGGEAEASTVGSSKPSKVELGEASSNGRLQSGSSSFQDEDEDIEEQPLVWNRPRRTSSSPKESPQEVEVAEASTLPSTGQQDNSNPAQHNENSFQLDEWGGISSVEHDEAVMLEAAMFGGIPEGTGYRYAYAPHEFMQSRGSYPRPTPRPPSPSLTAQRLIREQQDDEYLASLQADREKELKAIEEAEAAREEERRREEESRRKLQEEQELETQLVAKEASLPPEPSSDDENAVTLLVRMPDGSRRGRRFLRSNKLQSLFDFIDIARVVKPGTYRLVRPYPRRAFSYEESASILEELGLTNKQEALFLELV
ncbi:hypothetical protein AAHE18_15G074100 [Arachis hypogaea]